MKRYYICDLVAYSDPDPTVGTAFAPSVSELGVNFTAVYPPKDASGAYMGDRCLVLVNAADHVAVQLDLRNRAKPDFPLDVKINSMDGVTRAAWETMLAANGFAVDWAPSDGYRVAIRSVGRQLDPNFHEDNFDVSA